MRRARSAAASIGGRPDQPAQAEEVERREIDLRLGVGALTAWAAVLAVLAWPTARVVTAAAAAVILALAVLGVHLSRDPSHSRARSRGRGSTDRRRGSPLPAVAMALLCAGGMLLTLAARVHQVRDGPVAELAIERASAVVEATVTADPRSFSAGVPAAGARFAIDATVTGIRSGTRSYRVRAATVIVAGPGIWATLVPGQRIRLDGRLAPPRDPTELLAATITARGQPTLVGVPPWWQRAALRVRADLRTASRGLPQLERGLLPGLVDGDTSGLDPVLKEQFKVAGLTHLVAVSGTNAAILIGAVLLLLTRMGVRPGLRAVIGAATLVAFVIVARPSPSVVRAAVMAAVVLIALASGRPRQGLPALSLAVLVLLAWRPEWARNAGFAMSVLATGALLVIAPGWADALRRRHVPPVIAEGIAVAAAASIVTAPVVVLLSGQISLVALPANLLAEAAVAPATVLGILAAATAPFSTGTGAFFAQLAGVPCRWLVGTAEFFGSRPGATLAWPSTLWGASALAALSLVAVAAVHRRRLRWPVLAAALTAVIVQIPVRSFSADWPVAGAILVVCDVGQGDGLVLPAGGDAAVVVDSGPEPVAIDRCLRSLGITRVLVYVQSHFDLDHVGGIAGAFRGREVGLVVTGPLQAPPLGRAVMDRALRPLGITSRVAALGTTIDAGRVHLDVLQSRVVELDGEPDSNNSSLVVRATVDGRTILLLGDASTEAQQLLLASRVDVRADVLKIAHHGSAYFEPALYAAVHARVAVASMGARNTYGHPSPRVLHTLAELGVPFHRTDQEGDVAVVPSGRDGLRTVAHQHSVTAAGPVPRSPPTPSAFLAGPTPSALSAFSAGPGPSALSVRHATMDRWPDPLAPMATVSDTAGSSWSSATRSSWSPAPSSRSPPPAGPVTPRPN